MSKLTILTAREYTASTGNKQIELLIGEQSFGAVREHNGYIDLTINSRFIGIVRKSDDGFLHEKSGICFKTLEEAAKYIIDLKMREGST